MTLKKEEERFLETHVHNALLHEYFKHR